MLMLMMIKLLKISICLFHGMEIQVDLIFVSPLLVTEANRNFDESK